MSGGEGGMRVKQIPLQVITLLYILTIYTSSCIYTRHAFYGELCIYLRIRKRKRYRGEVLLLGTRKNSRILCLISTGVTDRPISFL